jgi:glycine/D-amino acid oxidase-like deaminating enzyme
VNFPCGLTTGAITGKILVEPVSGRPTDINLTPFRIDRDY